MKREAYISIEDGTVSNKRTMRNLFLGLPDGRYEIRIESKNHRTLSQNRYYFGVVVPLVKEGLIELGHEVSMEETHDFLRSKFNYLEIVDENTGQVERIPKSTTGLTKQGFSNYIERIQQFAAEFLNIVIPEAGKQLKAEL
jgi:hypothetical protein